MKKIICIIISLCMLLSFSACADELKNYRRVQSLDNLENRKIGVNVGWANDYLITQRDDAIIYRYDTTSDMLMALCYKQLDAILVEEYEWKTMKAMTQGLEAFPESILSDDWMMDIANDRQDLCDELNEFIAAFNQTETYQAWLDRTKSFDGVNYKWPEDLTFPTEGKPLHVAYMAENFPAAFPSSGGEDWGYDLEYLCYFCQEYGYTPTFYPTSEVDIYEGLSIGKYDLTLSYISTLWEDDALAAGLHTTIPYISIDMWLVEIDDPDNVAITGTIDF